MEGQDCTVKCINIAVSELSVLEWTWPKRNMRLLVFRGGRVQDGFEDPAYTNRTQIQAKNANFCLVLKNVVCEDSGKYEYHAEKEDGEEFSEFFYLTVIKPESTNNITNPQFPSTLLYRLIAGVLVGLFLLITIALILIRKKLKHLKHRKISKNPTSGSKHLPDVLVIIPEHQSCDSYEYNSDSSTSSGKSVTSMKSLLPSNSEK